MEYPLFDFKDHFSDINDFDFMDNGNDIMVNEAAINFSKVDVGVELPPPLVTTNEQTQLDPMNANLNTFGEEEMLLKDGVYTTQPVYSECRVNSIETNQFNRHIGSSLPEDGVYTAKPVYLEGRVNSLQKNTLNGHVGSNLQHELLRLSEY
ncbi:hypothetical protein Goklo_005175 [Gossypium klotzschianum]|uniref:Uncharacterized protein n=1 Tax=Gossypium klotzschianum TaxID=34286 RepID=A0A7J8VR68_9ROSI|nr:hypothetical protein [Gossypium klotzschianum]